MGEVKQDPQIGMEEVVIENPDLDSALEAWQQADAEYKEAGVGKLDKAKKDAKDAVIALLPPLDGIARSYRAGEHRISVSPPNEPGEPKARATSHRIQIKRVVED